MKGTAWGRAVGSSVPRHSSQFFVLLQKKPVKPSPTFIAVVSMTLTQCNNLQAFFSCELFHHYEQKEHKLKIQLKKLKQLRNTAKELRTLRIILYSI